MKLVRAHVRNFRSAMDTGEFEIGQRTCLVGKNEAGKTAVLQALHGVNPTDDFAYDGCFCIKVRNATRPARLEAA